MNRLCRTQSLPVASRTLTASKATQNNLGQVDETDSNNLARCVSNCQALCATRIFNLEAFGIGAPSNPPEMIHAIFGWPLCTSCPRINV